MKYITQNGGLVYKLQWLHCMSGRF